VITFLRGIVAKTGDGYVDLDVNGVGYRVRVPADVAMVLQPESAVTLYTYHHIREDAQELYGFLDADHREWFELLLGVSGIGPKGAMQVVSAADYGRFLGAISGDDTTYLSGLPGIGKKTAQRMVIDLKDKVRPLAGGALATVGADSGNTGETGTLQRDLVEALQSLGYNERQAMDVVLRVLATLEEGQHTTLEAALTKCLQSMAG